MEVLEEKGKRFYIQTANGEAELLYRIDGKTISMYHTFVPEEERGKVIAEMLGKKAFEYAIKEDLKVKPDCSYIRHFLDKNPEFKKYSI